jgi:hypothetical protein
VKNEKKSKFSCYLSLIEKLLGEQNLKGFYAFRKRDLFRMMTVVNFHLLKEQADVRFENWFLVTCLTDRKLQ